MQIPLNCALLFCVGFQSAFGTDAVVAVAIAIAIAVARLLCWARKVQWEIGAKAAGWISLIAKFNRESAARERQRWTSQADELWGLQRCANYHLSERMVVIAGPSMWAAEEQHWVASLVARSLWIWIWICVSATLWLASLFEQPVGRKRVKWIRVTSSLVDSCFSFRSLWLRTSQSLQSEWLVSSFLRVWVWAWAKLANRLSKPPSLEIYHCSCCNEQQRQQQQQQQFENEPNWLD